MNNSKMKIKKTFYCTQDIRLLYGSFLSATATNLKFDDIDCANVRDPIQTVSNSIKMIMHRSIKEAKSAKEKANNQLHCNERLHVVVFFNTLRSNGIRSQAADEFYESICYYWPSINLKFYVELNFKCDWSEYFIMCAVQLPSETLLELLKMIFEIPFETDVKCYSWHLILQILILKLFKIPYDKKSDYPFNFDFIVDRKSEETFDESTEKNSEKQGYDKTHEENPDIFEKYDEIDESNTVFDNCSETVAKENNSNDDEEEEERECLAPFSYKNSDDEDEDSTKAKEENLLPFVELSNSLYNNIAFQLEKMNETDLLKVLLHFAKTVLKVIKDGKKDYESALPFQNYVKLLKDYLSTDFGKNKLTVELEKCSATFTMHAYATVSWNICLNYLIFLLKHYIDELFPSIPCSKLLDETDLFYKNLTSVISALNCLNYPLLKSDEHIATLCKIIEMEFEGSSYAVKFLLSDQSVLKLKNVLVTLEENCHMINLSQFYTLIIDHIMSTDSPGLKHNLLKILYTCLQMNKLDMYNTVIGYINSNYGLTKEFQLPDYHNRLRELSYKTPTQEELEKEISDLFIQNPKSTLRYLIDEALIQGPEGKHFFLVLKQLNNACFYMEKSGQVCILHDILDGYFSEVKLTELRLKNMVTLYKFLVKVHMEIPILLPCTFLSECIVPKLCPEYKYITKLLECTKVLIPTLLSDDSFLKEDDIFYNFILKLGMLLNDFIANGNAKMKSLVLPLLKDLEKHPEILTQIDDLQKLRLRSCFENFDQMISVYFEKFLPENTGLISRAAIWVHCCKNKDLTNFEAKFSVENLTYTSLVNTLVEVLPHLTKKEWSFCYNLLKICCSNKKVQDGATCSNNVFQLRGSDLVTYAVISTVLNSAHFILNGNKEGSLYLSSCVSNFLKNAIFQKEVNNPCLLFSAALEICFFITTIPPDTFQIYCVILLEIQKEIRLHASETDENYAIWDMLNHVIARNEKFMSTGK